MEPGNCKARIAARATGFTVFALAVHGMLLGATVFTYIALRRSLTDLAQMGGIPPQFSVVLMHILSVLFQWPTLVIACVLDAVVLLALRLRASRAWGWVWFVVVICLVCFLMLLVVVGIGVPIRGIQQQLGIPRP